MTQQIQDAKEVREKICRQIDFQTRRTGQLPETIEMTKKELEVLKKTSPAYFDKPNHFMGIPIKSI